MDAPKILSRDIGCKLDAMASGDSGDFYMIWREGARRPPKVIHADELTAAREANRLSSVAPGKRFIVMRSVGYAQTQAQ